MKLMACINIMLLMALALANSSDSSMLMAGGAELVDVLRAQADATDSPDSEFVTIEFPYEVTDELLGANIATAWAVADTFEELTGPQGLIQQGLMNVYSDVYVGGSGGPLNSYIRVFSDESKIVATDFVIPELRDRLVFSHENTARAEVMTAHPLLRNFEYHSDTDTWIRIYTAIDQHPRFGDIVSLLREASEIPNRGEPRGDEYYDWIFEIARDLIDQFFHPDGRPKSL